MLCFVFPILHLFIFYFDTSVSIHMDVISFIHEIRCGGVFVAMFYDGYVLFYTSVTLCNLRPLLRSRIWRDDCIHGSNPYKRIFFSFSSIWKNVK